MSTDNIQDFTEYKETKELCDMIEDIIPHLPTKEMLDAADIAFKKKFDITEVTYERMREVLLICWENLVTVHNDMMDILANDPNNEFLIKKQLKSYNDASADIDECAILFPESVFETNWQAILNGDEVQTPTSFDGLFEKMLAIREGEETEYSKAYGPSNRPSRNEAISSIQSFMPQFIEKGNNIISEMLSLTDKAEQSEWIGGFAAIDMVLSHILYVSRHTYWLLAGKLPLPDAYKPIIKASSK